MNNQPGMQRDPAGRELRKVNDVNGKVTWMGPSIVFPKFPREGTSQADP